MNPRGAESDQLQFNSDEGGSLSTQTAGPPAERTPAVAANPTIIMKYQQSVAFRNQEDLLFPSGLQLLPLALFLLSNRSAARVSRPLRVRRNKG